MQPKRENSSVQPVVTQPGKEHPSTALQHARDFVDQDASEIGELYATARSDMVNSMRMLIDAGRRLKVKKASLPHGQWLPWLEANADALGFGDVVNTPQRLMKAAEKADSSLATNLTADTARALSREIWGHTASPRRAATVARQANTSSAPALGAPNHPALDALRRMHREVVRDTKPAAVADALSGDECHEAGIHAAAIGAWLQALQVEIERSCGVHPVKE
jgi:hypothetical protein